MANMLAACSYSSMASPLLSAFSASSASACTHSLWLLHDPDPIMMKFTTFFHIGIWLQNVLDLIMMNLTTSFDILYSTDPQKCQPCISMIVRIINKHLALQGVGRMQVAEQGRKVLIGHR